MRKCQEIISGNEVAVKFINRRKQGKRILWIQFHKIFVKMISRKKKYYKNFVNSISRNFRENDFTKKKYLLKNFFRRTRNPSGVQIFVRDEASKCYFGLGSLPNFWQQLCHSDDIVSYPFFSLSYLKYGIIFRKTLEL